MPVLSLLHVRNNDVVVPGVVVVSVVVVASVVVVNDVVVGSATTK